MYNKTSYLTREVVNHETNHQPFGTRRNVGRLCCARVGANYSDSYSYSAPAAPATGCTEEFKTATYKKYYDNRKDKQDIAFQAAEEWIATCPTDESPYAAAIKKFHAAYKAATGTTAAKKQFEEAYTKKNYADQMRLGKQLIAVEPDNTAVSSSWVWRV